MAIVAITVFGEKSRNAQFSYCLDPDFKFFDRNYEIRNLAHYRWIKGCINEYRLFLPYSHRLKRTFGAMIEASLPWRHRVEASLAKRRRAVAVAVSFALHGLLLVLLICGMHPNISAGGSGGASFAGSGTGTGLSVELVDAHHLRAEAFKVKAPDPSDTADPTDFTPAQLLTTSMELDALDSLVATLVPIPDELSPLPNKTTVSASQNPASAGGAGQGGHSTGVVDALWKQIEPCWQRLANKSTRNVTLSVTFSPLGNVAQINDAADSGPIADAVSRNQAIEALSECGPYVSASSGDNLMIAFSTPQ